MHYLLLIYQDEAARSQWSEEEQAAEYQDYFTFTVESEKRGVSAGAALMPTNTATTVRVRNGKILTTDGHSLRRKSNSVAISSYTAMTLMRLSRLLRRFLALAMAPSRFGQ